MNTTVEQLRAANGLKRGDLKRLAQIVATNGGGLFCDLFPEAQRARLMNADLVRWKGTTLKQPWNALTATGMIIHTREGLEFDRAIADAEQAEVQDA